MTEQQHSDIPDAGTTQDDLDPHFADLGPFYRDDGARRQLGNITGPALAGMREKGSVLAVQTGDGTWLYPAWQFTGDGGVHDALTPVIAALADIGRWEAAVWLVSEHPDLNGLSPRRSLANGTPPELVAQLATHDAALRT